MLNNHGPDFVCIGAQKAGTTWLYDNLSIHPQIWMPPVKEIHFFNTICPNEQLLGIETHRHELGFAKYRPLLNNMNMFTLKWLYRYYNEQMSTSWYYRLFDRKTNKEQIAGDITPAYSTLDERGIRLARKVLNENCKVFVILRSPIERTWSAVKMLFRWKGNDIQASDIEKLKNMLQEPSYKLRSNYCFIVKYWQEMFGNNFQIFLYDDLRADPKAFLYSIQDFLGVKHYVFDNRLLKKSNADKDALKQPKAINTFLRDNYKKDIEELDNTINGVSQSWLK